jgi:transcription antitermination factor NusG
MEKEKAWYILWSMNDCSRSKVELVLKGTDSELWVPLLKQVVGKETKEVPLYPGYYFVKCTPESVERINDRIKALRSRVNIIFMKNENKKAYTLTEEEISRIKEVEKEDINISDFSEGEKVRIVEGMLKECIARVVEVKTGFLKVIPTLFNRELGPFVIKDCYCHKLK